MSNPGTEKWNMLLQQSWENTAISRNRLRYLQKAKSKHVREITADRIVRHRPGEEKEIQINEATAKKSAAVVRVPAQTHKKIDLCFDRGWKEKCFCALSFPAFACQLAWMAGRRNHNWQLQISKLGPILPAGADRVPHLSLLYSIQASPVSKQCVPPSLSPFSLLCSAVGCDYTEEICQFGFWLLLACTFRI